MRRLLIFTGVLVLVGGTWAAAQNGGKGGTVKIDTPGLVLKVLAGKDKATGKQKQVPIPPGKEVPMPAGTYKVASAGLFAQDASRTVWGLETDGELGKLASLEITEGQTTTVEGGGPLQVKTSVLISGGTTATPNPKLKTAVAPLPKPKTVTVQVSYVGQAGESYAPKVTQNNRPGPRCEVRLVTEDGKVLSKGEYSYGCSVGGG